MPVYHFTLHAYRSWSPNHPRGFVRRGKGIQAPDPKMASQYDQAAKHPAVRFAALHQSVLVWGCHDICQKRGWRLHGASTDPSHLHTIISWKDNALSWRKVRQRLANVLSLFLGRATGAAGRRWFVADPSRKRVRDRAHLEHLIGTYLPSHRGIQWFEGQPAPPKPAGVDRKEEPPTSVGGY